MRNLIFRVLRYSGLPYLMREVFQRNKVTILLFHNIEAQQFQNVIYYFYQTYNIISLDYFYKCVLLKQTLPYKSIIITFDDGHKNNYNLLEIVKERKIPVTIFLCSGIVNSFRHFWFIDVKSSKVKGKLKTISNNERILELKERFSFTNKKEYTERQALNQNELEEMKKYFDFQSHTIFHPILPRCDDNEALKEIEYSKKQLETLLNRRLSYFSYPNGSYCERDIKLVKKTGYLCAVTVDYGFNSINSDLFILKRLSVNDSEDINEIIVKSSGLWGLLTLKWLKIKRL